MRQKGFAPIIVILLVVLVGFVYYFYFRGITSEKTPTLTFSPSPTQSSTSIDTSKWISYQNLSYEIEFRYPPGWNISEKNNYIEVCIPGYNTCAKIQKESRDVDAFNKYMIDDYGACQSPSSDIKFPENSSITGKTYFTECQQKACNCKTLGWIFINHKPNNIVIYHAYNDAFYPNSIGAILLTLKFVK